MENEVFKISIFWKLGIVQVRLFGTLRVLRCSYSDFWEKEERLWLELKKWKITSTFRNLHEEKIWHL